MCGRYVNHVGAMHGWTDILQDWPAQGNLSFNVAPTQMAPIVTPDGCEVYRWGLLPSWVEGTSTRFSTFNARLATLGEKPAFRNAWHKGQRCLVPALGYFEWREENGRKQAYFVCRKDGLPIVFGGLYEPVRQQAPGSFTIITRPSEGMLAELHHATPLMFEPEPARAWLSVDTQQAFELANQPLAENFRYYPVSDRVNKVTNQGSDLIEPCEPKMTQQGFGF